MANVNFIPLGQWFPYMGKTMVVSNFSESDKDTTGTREYNIEMYMVQLVPGISIDSLKNKSLPDMINAGRAVLVGTINETTVISDIPQGVAFILVDDIEYPAQDGQGCFVTSMDAGYRISGSNITNR